MVAMAYVDLDEIAGLLGGQLLRRSPGLLRFRRRDYHGDPRLALDDAVKRTVEDAIGTRPEGPVRLLTNLRSLGLCFNPVSFYYCFDRSGEQLRAVLADVTNTPWGERQAYVIAGDHGSVDKQMHVSPFMPMDQTYTFRAQAPAERVSVTVENHRAGRREFFASLQMRRAELTPGAVRRLAFEQRVVAIRTLTLIYGHALGLRLAGARAYPHPKRGAG